MSHQIEIKCCLIPFILFFFKQQDESISFSADRFVEHVLRSVIVWITQGVTALNKTKSITLNILFRKRFIYSMDVLGFTVARPVGGSFPPGLSAMRSWEKKSGTPARSNPASGL